MPSAVMISELAQHAADQGHEVTVFTTFPSLPGGKIFPEFRRRIRQVFRRDGVRVVRCFSFTVGPERKVQWRVLSHISFGFMAASQLLFGKRFDIVVCDVFPIIAAPFILIASTVRGTPVINYIQDVYPESAEAAGFVKAGSLISRIALSVDRWVCNCSAVNVTIDESLKKTLARTRGLNDEQLEVVHNWIDGSRIKPTPRTGGWRRENGIEKEKILFMFAGTMGHVSGVDILITVAEELQKRKREDVLIVCIGEGPLKPKMVNDAERLDLRNILFLPFQPTGRLSEVQSEGDVMFLPMQQNHQVSSVPSKLIAYMAAGRPILCSAPLSSTVSQIVMKADCGRVVFPAVASAIADTLGEMVEDVKTLMSNGANSRTFFENHFDLDIAMKRFDRLLSRFNQEGLTAGVRSAARGQNSRLWHDAGVLGNDQKLPASASVEHRGENS